MLEGVFYIITEKVLKPALAGYTAAVQAYLASRIVSDETVDLLRELVTFGLESDRHVYAAVIEA